MGLQVKLKAGELDVLTTGSVIGLVGKPVEISLEAEGPPIVVRFVFTSSEDKKPEFDWKAIGPREGEVTLRNFDNALGIGNNEPIRIGSFSNREMFVCYRVYRVATAAHQLHYTFYLGAKV